MMDMETGIAWGGNGTVRRSAPGSRTDRSRWLAPVLEKKKKKNEVRACLDAEGGWGGLVGASGVGGGPRKDSCFHEMGRGGDGWEEGGRGRGGRGGTARSWRMAEWVCGFAFSFVLGQLHSPSIWRWRVGICASGWEEEGGGLKEGKWGMRMDARIVDGSRRDSAA